MSSILARSFASLSFALLVGACADDGDGVAALVTAPLGGGGAAMSRPESDREEAGESGAPNESENTAPTRRPPPDETSLPAPTQPAQGDVAKLAAGNSAFGFALFRAVGEARAGENVVFSPYGVSSALAMVFAGARRLTEAELGATLRFEVPPPALHAAFAQVAQQLDVRGRGDGIALKLGSSVWVRPDLPIAPDYEALLRASYGGPPEVADFAADPARARAAINARIAERTGAKIAELLRPDDVAAETQLVLTSAAYLSARWKTPLAPGAPARFTSLDGAASEVPTLTATGTFAHARGEGWEAIALPYAGDALRLIAVLPDAGAYETVEGEASAAWFDSVRGALKDAPLAVTLPKWQARARTPLREALEALDVRSLFRGGDLTGISEEGVALDDVIHEAAVEVAEDTGASAGGDVAREGAAVRFDRPFMYAVVDEPTGQILFLGRVVRL